MNPFRITPETAFNLVATLIGVGLLILGAAIVLRVVGLLISRMEHAITEDASGHHDLAKEKRAHTIGDVLRRTVRGVVVVIVALMALRMLGLDINPLLATFGGFGVAAGLGAQSLVRDWIAGYFIIRDNQFAVGDVIRTAGVSGTVEALSLRHAEIRDGDGSLHFVPNGESKIVTNLTKSWATPTVRVPVSLTEDPVRALQELRDMLPRFSQIPEVKAHLLETPRVLGVEDVSAGQFTILLQARTTSEQRLAVSRALRLAAMEQLRAAGIGLQGASSQDAPVRDAVAAGAASSPGETA